MGYFQVTNASTFPVQLGAEMTNSAGQVTRHKMFAIVDRSALTFLTGPGQTNQPGPAPIFLTATNASANNPPVAGSPFNPQNTVWQVNALSGTSEGVSWSLTPGTQLTFDTGANQETVTISSVNATASPPTITINTPSLPHNAVSVTIGVAYPGPTPWALGNPGPQPANFDPRTVGGVVKYYRLVN